MGSVGCGRQVIWITDGLSNNKWTIGHLEVRWQVTMAEKYERVMW